MPDYYYPVISGNSRVTSGIGPRNAPTAGASTNHAGVDLSGGRGVPIVAPVDLTISHAGRAGGYGNAVYGIDAYGNQHRFGHLDGYNVSAGDRITAGTQLGILGSTGRSTGPHLHYETRDPKGRVTNLAAKVVGTGQRLIKAGTSKIKKCGFNPFCIAKESIGIVTSTFDGEKGNAALDESECGTFDIICKLKQWILGTEFVERAAIYFLAMIFIGAGILFLSKGVAVNAASNSVLGVARKAIRR